VQDANTYSVTNFY